MDAFNQGKAKRILIKFRGVNYILGFQGGQQGFKGKQKPSPAPLHKCNPDTYTYLLHQPPIPTHTHTHTYIDYTYLSNVRKVRSERKAVHVVPGDEGLEENVDFSMRVLHTTLRGHETAVQQVLQLHHFIFSDLGQGRGSNTNKNTN